MMRVYGVQTDIDWENKAVNHTRVQEMLASVFPERGSLVLLPEMFATGFSMNVAGIADQATHETQAFLAELAAMHDVYIMGGVVVADADGRGRNQCVIYGPNGDELARYSKIRPFTFGGESDHYEAGERVEIFEWEGFRVAPFICFDLRFPELFRTAAAKGANLLTVIANWPETRVAHWECLLRARAIENQAYVIGVNRSGRDPFLSYPGRSLIIDPNGETLAEAGAEETIMTAQLDPGHVDSIRRKLPFLADMLNEEKSGDGRRST
jgi:omega-amidase